MSANTFTCPSCATVLKTAQPLPAGHLVRCPKCGQTFAAPGEAPAAPRKAAAPRPQPAAPARRPPSPRKEAAQGQGPPAPPPARSAPPAPKKKRGSALTWVFLSLGCLALVCLGGVTAAVGGLWFLADQAVAVASSRAAEPAQGKPPLAVAPTAPAGMPPVTKPDDRVRGDDVPVKPKPDDLPPDEGKELDRAVLAEVRDQAVTWVKENNRFRPEHMIVTDMGKLIDEQAEKNKGFLLTLDGGLLKSGKPTLLCGRSGELFVFELTPDQAKAAKVTAMNTLFQSTTEQKDLKRPAPRIRLADLMVANAQALDGSKRITGTVVCKRLEKGPGVTLRLSSVSGARTITATQPLDDADLVADQPIAFSFGALDEAGGTPFSGLLVGLLEVIAPAGPDQPGRSVLVSNSVAVLVTVSPTRDVVTPVPAGKPDPVTMIKRLEGSSEVDEDAPGKPIVSVDLAFTKATDADLAQLRDLKQLKELDLSSAEGVTDAGLAHLKGLTNLESLNLSGLKLKGAGLAHLSGLTKLRRLVLPVESFTPQQLTPLTALTNLEELDVYLAEDTDAKLAVLAGLKKLRRLDLQNTKLTDKGMEQIGKLTGLEDLWIIDTNILGGVSDAGLAQLKGLTKLHNLILFTPRATNAGVMHLQGLSGLRELELSGFDLTDAGLAPVAKLTGLEVLRLPVTKVTDAGLEHVKGLTGLQVLDLSATGVSDAGLVHLKDLRRLERLELNRTKVTGSGLVHLKGLAGLRVLHLDDAPVGDAGAAALKELKGLIELDLDNAPLTDAGLAHLKELTELGRLTLDGTKISDAGLVHLKGMTKLGVLRLDNNQSITDASIVHLKELKTLYDLNLEKTRITPKGVEMLKAALPQASIRVSED